MYKTYFTKVSSETPTPEMNLGYETLILLTILTIQHPIYIPQPEDFDSILDPNPELNPLPLVEFDPVPQPRLAELVP